jgi:hypothetical protein
MRYSIAPMISPISMNFCKKYRGRDRGKKCLNLKTRLKKRGIKKPGLAGFIQILLESI